MNQQKIYKYQDNNKYNEINLDIQRYIRQAKENYLEE